MKQTFILINFFLIILVTGCSSIIDKPSESTEYDYTESSNSTENTEIVSTIESTENTETTTSIESNTNIDNAQKYSDNVLNNGGSIIQIDNTVYYIHNDKNPGKSNYAIYSMNIDGSDKKKIIDIDFAYELYSVDNYIIYNGYNDGQHAVFRYSIDTGELIVIADGELEYFDAEEKEIYYSVSYPSYNSLNYDWSIHKTDIHGNNNIVICSDSYSFIKKVDDTIYLQKTTPEKEFRNVVLASVDSNGNNLKDIASIPRLSGESSSFIDNEHIYGLDTYNEWLILTVGSYQGIDAYLGGLVKLKKDGSELERLTDFDTDKFYVIDDYIYFNSTISDIYGCCKYNIDSEITEFLGENVQWLLFASDDKHLYYVSNKSDDEYLVLNNLMKCDLEGNNIIKLFDSKDVPFYDDSNYVGYENIESVGDYLYFAVKVHGYTNDDFWRGHTCYYANYRIKKDGTKLEMLYKNEYAKCSESE